MNTAKKLDGLQKALLIAAGLSALVAGLCFFYPKIFDLGGGLTSSALSWTVVVLIFCGGLFFASRKIDVLQAWLAKAPKRKILKLASLVAGWFLVLAVVAGVTSVAFQARVASGHMPDMAGLHCEEGQLVFAPTRELPWQEKRLTVQEAQELQDLVPTLKNGAQTFVTRVDSNALVISLEGSDYSFYPEYVSTPYGYFQFDNYESFYSALARLFPASS